MFLRPDTNNNATRPSLEVTKINNMASVASSSLPRDAIAYFESVARSHVDAVNARDFSIHSPAWAACARDFEAARGGLRGNQQRYWVDIHGLLDELKAITTRSPDYHVVLHECSLQLGATADSALFHMPQAVTGDPPGITLYVVGVMAFEKIDGEWKLVRYWGTMGPPGFDAMRPS